MWVGFVAFVLAMLTLNLGVFHRREHVVRGREAVGWSAVWIALALAFGAGIFLFAGPEKGAEFLTGYIVEKSLSVDNLFVFVILFDALSIPPRSQHRVLSWGILTALVLRAAMIVVGAVLLAQFEWLLYVFGAFLVFTGWRLWRGRASDDQAGTKRILRAVRRVIPATTRLHGDSFVVRLRGRWLATPLLLALAAVEVADVVFAVDSIPAVFAVTRDPFIVFTSNIFAILGLRSLYFLLAGLLGRLAHLQVGLAAVLVFVGLKMLAAGFLPIPPAVSLGVIAGILLASVGASLARPRPLAVDAARPDPGRRAPDDAPGG